MALGTSPAAHYNVGPLARQVAADRARHGWRLARVSNDNAGGFTSAIFTEALHRAGVRHTRIRAGRPQRNGSIERVHETNLEECYYPTFGEPWIAQDCALTPPCAAGGKGVVGEPMATAFWGACYS